MPLQSLWKITIDVLAPSMKTFPEWISAVITCEVCACESCVVLGHRVLLESKCSVKEQKIACSRILHEILVREIGLWLLGHSSFLFWRLARLWSPSSPQGSFRNSCVWVGGAGWGMRTWFVVLMYFTIHLFILLKKMYVNSISVLLWLSCNRL